MRTAAMQNAMNSYQNTVGTNGSPTTQTDYYTNYIQAYESAYADALEQGLTPEQANEYAVDTANQTAWSKLDNGIKEKILAGLITKELETRGYHGMDKIFPYSELIKKWAKDIIQSNDKQTPTQALEEWIKKHGQWYPNLSNMSSNWASGWGFKNGGLNDYTGLAMLHGTKSKPESVLTAEQTAFLRNDLLGSSPYSLMSIITDVQDLLRSNSVPAISNSNDSVVFENVVLNFEGTTIANDYDARRAGQQALDEMMRIARKSGNNSVSRR